MVLLAWLFLLLWAAPKLLLAGALAVLAIAADAGIGYCIELCRRAGGGRVETEVTAYGLTSHQVRRPAGGAPERRAPTAVADDSQEVSATPRRA